MGVPPTPPGFASTISKSSLGAKPPLNPYPTTFSNSVTLISGKSTCASQKNLQKAQ